MRILEDITKIPSEILSNLFRKGILEYILIGLVIFGLYWMFFK